MAHYAVCPCRACLYRRPLREPDGLYQNKADFWLQRGSRSRAAMGELLVRGGVLYFAPLTPPRRARFLLIFPVSGTLENKGSLRRLMTMFEIAAFGAVGLFLVIVALVGSILVDNWREQRDLAQLSSLLNRLGVAEGAVSADSFPSENRFDE